MLKLVSTPESEYFLTLKLMRDLFVQWLRYQLRRQLHVGSLEH
jgi:hypothetical protein